MSPPRTWSLCLALATAPAALKAQADPGRAAALKAAADKAYGEGDYLNALKLLQAAYAAQPDPALRANIGLVYREIGEYAEAVAALRAFLGSQPPPEKARMAEGMIAELEPEVQIQSQPPGAAIHLDDAPKPSATTPATLRLVAGTHRLVLRLPGHAPATKRITLRPGQPQQVALTLEPQAGGQARAAAAGAAPGGAAAAGPAAAGLAAAASPPPAAGPSRAGAFALIGVGVVAAGGAVAAQLLGRAAAEDRDQASTGAAWDDAHAAVGTWSWVFWGSAGLSLAALGAGVALLGRGGAAPVSLQLGPGGASLGGRF